MKVLVTVIWGSLLASSAFAQDRSVVADAIATLRASSVDTSGPCGALKITNYVAFRNHYALLHKAGGFRAVLKADGSCLSGEQSSDPEGFATDYLIDPRTGFGFDILGDGGGANTPQWAGPENAPDMVARNWQNLREPFDPSAYLQQPTPAPIPTPAPPIVVLPSAPTCDLAALETAIANLRADVDAGRQENQQFYAEARSKYKAVATFIGKYGPIVLGAIMAGRATK